MVHVPRNILIYSLFRFVRHEPGQNGLTRPKISLHLLVNNPAIKVHLNVSTKIALHLI